jgi:hypothetical protein
MDFNVNCRLLEKHNKLRSGLLNLEMQTYGRSQKRKGGSVTSQKNSEVSTQSESFR